MSQEAKAIKKALSLFSSYEKTELHWSGSFVTLYSDLRFAAQQNQKLKLPSKLIPCILQDIWNISTLIHRLSWLRTAPIDNDFIDDLWGSYASVDIEHFHVEFRSIMDYAAKIVAHFACKNGQAPTTFRSLFNWVARNQGNRRRLGEDLAVVVESAAWFADLRGIRDTVIHSGSFTMVFGNRTDGILFQVFKNMGTNLIEHKTLMLNENVVYFERYAAIYLAHLFIFLETLAETIYQMNNLQPLGIGATCASPGFSVIVGWMNDLKKRIEEG